MEINFKKVLLVMAILFLVFLLGLGGISYMVISNLMNNQDQAKEGIAVINISGPIIGGAGGDFLNQRETSSDQIMRQINRAKKNKKIKAIILRVNTPGGSSAASDAIYEELRKFKETGRPIVVSMGDMAASGGYYVSAAADKIYANPATITGSIGVIMKFNNLKELYNKVGIDSLVFKSGPYKDIGNPDRKMTSEEKEILQSIVNKTYDRFIEVVAIGRDMPKEKIKELADGRIYTGSQAKKVGLVDKLGTFYDAVDATAKLVGLKGDPHLIYYNRLSPIERLLSSINKSINYSFIEQLGNNLKNNDNLHKNNTIMLYSKYLQKNKEINLENLQLTY